MPTMILLQAVAPDSWQSQILMFLLTVLSAVVTAAVPVLVLWLRKRLKLQANAAVEGQVSQITIRGIQWAEEQAGKALKSKLPAHSSNDKLDAAVKFVLAEIKRYQLPSLAAEHAKDLIESHLPEYRNGWTLSHPIEPLPPVPPDPTE